MSTLSTPYTGGRLGKLASYRNGKNRNYSFGKSPRKDAPLLNYNRHTFPIFAHERLDPTMYPPDIGRAVGTPISPIQYAGGEHDASAEPSDVEANQNIDFTVRSLLGGPMRARGSSSVEAAPSALEASIPRKPTLFASEHSTHGKRKRNNSALCSRNSLSKTPGGRPAVPKFVSWELDSTDEIISTMKKQKFSDSHIAKLLRDEGRMNYSPKTISSRWARIQKAIEAHEEELIDSGAKSWPAADDQFLVDAIDLAETQMNHEIDKVRNSKWTYVARHLKNMKPGSKYSAGACEKRIQAISAPVVPEGNFFVEEEPSLYSQFVDGLFTGPPEFHTGPYF